VIVFFIIYFQEREKGGGEIRTLGSGSPRTLESLACLWGTIIVVICIRTTVVIF